MIVPKSHGCHCTLCTHPENALDWQKIGIKIFNLIAPDMDVQKIAEEESCYKGTYGYVLTFSPLQIEAWVIIFFCSRSLFLSLHFLSLSFQKVDNQNNSPIIQF